MLLVKFLVVLLLLFIVASLFTSLAFLLKDKGQGNRAVKALTVRIVLSIVAFLFIIASQYFGFLEPKVVPFLQQQNISNATPDAK